MHFKVVPSIFLQNPGFEFTFKFHLNPKFLLILENLSFRNQIGNFENDMLLSITFYWIFIRNIILKYLMAAKLAHSYCQLSPRNLVDFSLEKNPANTTGLSHFLLIGVCNLRCSVSQLRNHEKSCHVTFKVSMFLLCCT